MRSLCSMPCIDFRSLNQFFHVGTLGGVSSRPSASAAFRLPLSLRRVLSRSSACRHQPFSGGVSVPTASRCSSARTLGVRPSLWSWPGRHAPVGAPQLRPSTVMPFDGRRIVVPVSVRARTANRHRCRYRRMSTRIRAHSTRASPAPLGRNPAPSAGRRRLGPDGLTSCHAEGRGFESLQPLLERPAFAGLFRCSSRVGRLRNRPTTGQSCPRGLASAVGRCSLAGDSE